MSLSLTASFAAQTNLVLPLAQSAAATGLAVRVATAGSGTLGTLSAVGASAVTWSIRQNPSWISATPDPANPLNLIISFTGAQAQQNPYQFYISGTDGVTTVYFAILVEVRDPFSIATASGSTTLTIPSYDSTVADTVIQGIGLNGIAGTGVQFLPIVGLPPGLSAVTADGSSLILRVAAPSSGNVAGGITLFTTSPESTQIAVQAYQPGSMYDTPDRCFTANFTIESLSAKQGTLDMALAAQYIVSESSFRVDAYVSFLEGQGQAVTYEWLVGGTATGATASGGTSADSFIVWTPSGTGLVTFTLKVLNSLGAVIGQKSINPTLVSGSIGVPCSASSSWESTAGIKLEIDAALKQGYVGASPQLTISTPASELAVDETVTLTVSLSEPSLEAGASLSATTLTLTAAAPSANLSLLIPASGLDEKWVVSITAANGVDPTRTGFAQVTYESNGAAPLTVVPSSGASIAAATGGSITPISVAVTNLADLAVTPLAVSLQGAPNGLSVNSAGQITGNTLAPGSYTFKIIVDATGYARSYSEAVTLTVTVGDSPLVIASVTPSVTSIPDGQQFNVAWGITGDARVLNLVQNFTMSGVLGETQAVTSEVGSSVFSVVGSSFYGTAYSVPCMVLSSSIVSVSNLLNAPAVATVDENQKLTLNFTPPTVSGSYQAYKAFNIWIAQLPDGTPQLQTLPTGLPTGLEPTGATLASRLFEAAVPTGDLSIRMQALSADQTVALNALPWATALEFPTAVLPASVTLSASTVLLNQTVTFTLDPAYVGADSWRAVFADGTMTDWLPLSYKTIAKAFTTAGEQPVLIQTLRDDSANTPGVKLMRQVTETIFVMDQQYEAAQTESQLTSTLGLGGDAGFEVTSATNGSVALSPYEVVVRALVRNTMTNELKLLVATARTNNASSLLGTMAADVFPLLGRPRVATLIDPALYLSGTSVAAVNPVKIATTTLPTIIVGSPMGDFPMQIVPNSGINPYSWYAIGLPVGVKLSVDGTLSGTATVLGNYSVTFACMDSSAPEFIDEVTLPLSVVSNLAITPTTPAGAVVGTPYTAALQNTGGLAPFTWSMVAGALPLGLSLDPNTGLISGTPVTYNSTTDFSKAYSATFQVTDSIGAAASQAFAFTLSPAALQFGSLDQPNIFAATDYRLRVPVFGGKAPYTLASFTDDGTVGSGLEIASPASLVAIAGVEPATLALTVANPIFYPAIYPANVAIPLSATGGVAPYTFILDSSANNTLPSPTIYGGTLVANVTADGVYAATVRCLDAAGHSASATLAVTSKKQNGDAYTVVPVSVALNGSTNPSNWTVTPIAALPDAANGVAYAPVGSSYFGLALYESGVLHLSQRAGGSEPMVFSLVTGSLPPGIETSSGNSFGEPTDYSGIVLFNVSSGTFPIVNGSYSFEAMFANILTPTATVDSAVERNSITVTPTGGTTTPVVVIPNDATINLNLATLSGSPFGWYYPLTAEGGTGPYTFSVQSGTTLPAASITTLNGLPAFSSTTSLVGTYQVNLIATDSRGTASAPVSVNVVIRQTVQEPIHILTSTIPSSVFSAHVIPRFTYAIESDLVATWSAAGLPPGVTITTSPSNTCYLQGTPTTAGTYTIVITATSILYGTVATATYSLQIRACTAQFVNKPTQAIVGTEYRAINNTAIIQVQYTGYQPTDASLPLPTAANGLIGVPGTSEGGLPTTSVSSLTPTGFIMNFDYTNGAVGTDTITLGADLDTATFAVSYSALQVAATTSAPTISEYAEIANLNPPVAISGGLAPYTTVQSGFTDSRFSASGGSVQINASQFTAGGTYPCGVTVLVTDSSGQTATVTGTIQLTIRQESYITVNFQNYTWNVDVSSGTAFSASILPNALESIVQLGHAPYQYYVDAVTIPTGLNSFVKISPSKRVLAIQFNNTATSETIYDVSATLANAGTFVVAATSAGAAPAVGTYSIAITLRVVDNLGIVSSHACTLTLVIN